MRLGLNCTPGAHLWGLCADPLFSALDRGAAGPTARLYYFSPACGYGVQGIKEQVCATLARRGGFELYYLDNFDWGAISHGDFSA